MKTNESIRCIFKKTPLFLASCCAVAESAKKKKNIKKMYDFMLYLMSF